MSKQPWTVYITETNYGRISFETKEEAEAWLDCLDYDNVRWTDSETISRELIHSAI